MHVKKRIALVYCIIMGALLLTFGKTSCTSFVNYMEWGGLFTVERGE